MVAPVGKIVLMAPNQISGRDVSVIYLCLTYELTCMCPLLMIQPPEKKKALFNCVKQWLGLWPPKCIA
jgi:hypothetical protein